MRFSRGLPGILERRDHHARRLNEATILMSYGALLGIADGVRGNGITRWFNVGGKRFRATRDGDFLVIVHPPRNGEVIARVDLTLSPHNAESHLARAIQRIKEVSVASSE